MGGSVNLSRDPVPTSGPPFDSSWNCTAGNPGTTHEEIKREAGEDSFVKIVLVTAEDARNQHWVMACAMSTLRRAITGSLPARK
jgi:hypothetical protein